MLRSGFSSASARHDQPIEWLQTAAPSALARIRKADVVSVRSYGVLIEAVAAGKPVVSTDFPHARELLSSGAGLLVDRESPTAGAAALRQVLTAAGLAARMSAEAKGIAPELLWPAVSRKYHALAAATRQADAKLATA
ncbi:glycosyltransferase [Nocardia brasiliensis]|uniref:glycosyltransferase n=1 Tax=Nocardia brasiliensis TaxID=37326 RepID=UPI00366D624C